MISFLIGIATGLIVGWNLFPQPAIVQRFYERISNRFWRWVTSLLLLVFCIASAGCSVSGIPSSDHYPWRERAIAEIALVSVANGPELAPDVKPVVGSKCHVCNDPPGDCGVGKTGDGQVCDRCETCRGDGRIDEQDLRSEGHDSQTDGSELFVEMPKEITLHATAEQWKKWPSKWYAEKRPGFESRGWIVRVVLEPVGATEIAYYDVQAPDGEVFSFFTELTIEQIEHLETR